MSVNQLSKGAVNEACTSGQINEGVVLQIVQVGDKKPNSQRRIALSDGSFVVTGVVYGHAEDLFNNDEVKVNSIIALTNCTFTSANGKHSVNVNDFDVIQLGVPTQLGSPVKWTPNAKAEKETNTPAPSAKAAPPPPRAAPHPTRSVAQAHFNSISSLSTYISNFTILARVVKKEFKNLESKGLKILTLILADKSGDIKATAWRDHAEKFNELVEENQVYAITGGKVSFAKKQYNPTKHDCEITFDGNTKFELVNNADTEEIGKTKFNFVKISEIDNLAKDATVDIVGVAIDIQPSQMKRLKTGREVNHRSIEIADDSDRKIELNLWDRNCDLVQEGSNPIIVLKDAKIGEFNGRKNLTVGTLIQVDPSDIQEANDLREWYSGNPSLSSIKALSSTGGVDNSNRRTPIVMIKTIMDENLGGNGHTDYFDVIASIYNITPQRSFFYLACPNEKCSFKGLKDRDGGLFCESCGNMITDPVPRYNYKIGITDFTGTVMFVQVFGGGENIDRIMGMNAAEFKKELESLDAEDKIAAMLDKVTNRLKGKEFMFRLKANENVYNEKSTIRFNVVNTFEVKYDTASKRLLEEIAKYSE